jgi:hypothetical protein
MTSTEFQRWRKANPYIEDFISFPEGIDFHWARIHATWHEKQTDKRLKHLCAFAINLENGDIYLDCSKRKIWMKCVALTLGRPLFGFIKTIYHLSLVISIPIEIYKAIMKGRCEGLSTKEIAHAALLNVIHNVVDIIRTPLYTIAMTIVTLVAVLIPAYDPRRLYDLRAVAARLENALNRGEDGFWRGAICFNPIDNIMNMSSYHYAYTKLDTEYQDQLTLHGLNNLARSYVKYRRKYRNLFNNYGQLLNHDKTFTSTCQA